MQPAKSGGFLRIVVESHFTISIMEQIFLSRATTTARLLVAATAKLIATRQQPGCEKIRDFKV
jgi:hypothetical protein